MTLAREHESIIERGLEHLAPLTKAAARLYVESCLRPLREIDATDVRQAVAGALARAAR